MESYDHLFRRESGRMVAALTRVFGVHNLALVEDVVQDAFCRALETWRLRGIPPNPSAWLMTTAKHRAIDVLRRERTARTFAPEVGRLLQTEWTLAPMLKELFAPQAIADDQLRMMFSCCHPRLSEKAQVALILHMLCGFSVSEIANAFLSSSSAIEKRVTRAKKVLSGSRRLFDLADRDFHPRLSAIHRALYLLFNEGYHSASSHSPTRVELCAEAMRLVSLLTDDQRTSAPATFALAALMYLVAARLPARLDAKGNLRSLFEQDRSRWDANLVAQGRHFLERSATGQSLCEYHVEAAIASVHASAQRAQDTDWNAIVGLYDTLMTIRPSPVVALNRAIAIGQRDGPQRGLEALSAIAERDRLADYPFFAAALGELELRSGQPELAREHFRRAITLARNGMEKRFLKERFAQCDTAIPVEPTRVGNPASAKA